MRNAWPRARRSFHAASPRTGCERPALVSRIRPRRATAVGLALGSGAGRSQCVSAERSLARGGQRGDVLIDGREPGPHRVDAQMRGAGLAPGRDLLIDRR